MENHLQWYRTGQAGGEVVRREVGRGICGSEMRERYGEAVGRGMQKGAKEGHGRRRVEDGY